MFAHTENTLCSGDHVPWHNSLDGSDSRIQHMLMKADPQLQPMITSHGLVNFIQVNREIGVEGRGRERVRNRGWVERKEWWRKGWDMILDIQNVF